MKQIGPVRSAMPPHGRHANTTGTIFSLGEARSDRSAMPGGKVESQDSGALISVKTAFCRA
jgi:hypothetical protein